MREPPGWGRSYLMSARVGWGFCHPRCPAERVATPWKDQRNFCTNGIALPGASQNRTATVATFPGTSETDVVLRPLSG